MQCQPLIPALNAWAAGPYYTTARPIAYQFPGHGCMDDLTTERSFVLQARCVIYVLGLSFGMLSMGVRTKRF